MLTKSEKDRVRRELVHEIAKHPKGIASRTAIKNVTDRLNQSIPALNRHHTSGLLGDCIASAQVRFVVRAPKSSIVTV